MAKGKHSAKLAKPHPIETQLAELRDTHRCAIHIWEGDEAFKPHPSYVFPRFSYESINAKPAEAIASSIADNTMPVMSMSLLPSQSSNLGLRPYCAHWNQTFLHCGYLVDMSQNQPHPARVLRAALNGLGSGPQPLDKAMRLGRKGTNEVPELEAFYEAYLPPRKRGKARNTAEGEKAFRQAIAGENGSALSATQLDLLGNYYDTPAAPDAIADEDHPNLVDFNEILVASSASHIKAIVVPYMENTDKKASWFDPMVKLAGALAGLQHLDALPHANEKKQDLPVVIYHVTEPKLGHFSYLAQGREECTKVALNACQELYKQGIFGDSKADGIAKIREDIKFDVLQENVKNTLEGLDIAKPLSQQKAVEANLKRLAHPQRTRA